MIDSQGRFVWYELMTTDMEAARAFYADVVGWGTEDASSPEMGYTLFTTGGGSVSGLMGLSPDARKRGAKPSWIGYVGADDVDDTAERIKSLGGLVHVPPNDIPKVSRFSVVADPQRATLALIKGREGAQQQPPQADAPGHVVWRELIASNWEKAFVFYNTLLGWQKASASPDPTGIYQEFSAGTEAIGGMFNRPDGAAFSVWLYYFGVSDIEAAAKQIVALGGKIIYGPLTVPGAARLIQCRDPQGAVFGLMDRRVRITIGCYSPRDQQKPR